MTFIAFVNIVMEGIFKSQIIELVGIFDSECHSSNYCFGGSPAHRNQSGCIEKSRPDRTFPKIFLNSALLHIPANNLDHLLSLISYLDLVEPVTAPITSLTNKPRIEIIEGVIVMAEVIGREDKGSIHRVANIFIL